MLKKRFMMFWSLFCLLVLPGFGSADVLWNQPLSTDNTNAYYNQDYEVNGLDPQSDIWIADDFTNTKIWDISTIFVPGGYVSTTGGTTGLDNATALNWFIYENAAGIPNGYPGDGVTTPVWSLSIPITDPLDSRITLAAGTGGFLSNATVTLDSPHRLNPGTYWLVFYPELHSGVFGQYGRQPADTTNNSVAQIIQPTGVDGFPTTWTSVLAIDWATSFSMPALTQQDFAFRLEGTIIEPNIVVTPTAISFGNILINETSVLQTVTITNTGTTDLLISSITITGTAESMFDVAPGATNGCSLTGQTLTPSAACKVAVTFTPTAAGAQSANLRIVSNDSDAATTQVALSGTGVEALLSVSEGTIGTQIVISGSGFGTKKGKVLIGDTVIKVAKDGWASDEITAIVNKNIPVGTYPVTIKIQPYKTATPKVLTNAFTVVKPEIVEVSPSHGAAEAPIIITGWFFGTKKGKVYLGDDWKCKVTSWEMISTTGASTIHAEVSKKAVGGAYPLQVVNKIGRDTVLFPVP